MDFGVSHWVGIVVYLISIIANGLMNRQGRDASAGFTNFCFLLFFATIGFGYSWFRWWGVAGAFLAQLLGMLVVVLILTGRRRSA